jgi:hypothetical protein
VLQNASTLTPSIKPINQPRGIPRVFRSMFETDGLRVLAVRFFLLKGISDLLLEMLLITHAD